MGSTLCARSHKTCGREEGKIVGSTLQRHGYNAWERQPNIKIVCNWGATAALLSLSPRSSYVPLIHHAFEVLTVLQLTTLLCCLHWSPDWSYSSSFSRVLWKCKEAASLNLNARSRAACKCMSRITFSTRIHYRENCTLYPTCLCSFAYYLVSFQMEILLLEVKDNIQNL